MGKNDDAQGHVTLKRIVHSGQKMELVQDFMPVLVICKTEEDLGPVVQN